MKSESVGNGGGLAEVGVGREVAETDPGRVNELRRGGQAPERIKRFKDHETR